MGVMTEKDICEQKIRQVAIKAAIEIRKAKGLPEERNITRLYEEVAPLLGLSVLQLTTALNGDHLPAPHEMKNKDGKFVLPGKDCPKCGGKKTVFPTSVCRSCDDWKNGYRSSWSCIIKGCGYKELLTTPFTELLDEVAPGWKGGMKMEMGIKTVTDEGLK